jgi:16S rRNA (cytidine1402-2'-O)-methyltransferase
MHQDFPDSTLYMVSTPIGNLADITYRAAYILANVDGIACEDTRHTTHLLNHLGIQKPLLAIHDHNEITGSMKLLDLLNKGERWAYVSDAGTPGISDPGSKLVHTIQLAGKKIIPIPGVSAVTTALSVSGITTSQSDGMFQFLGFLPTKGRDRKLTLEKIYSSTLASVFYESPQRIKETLSEICSTLKNEVRHVLIGRELTEKFESIHCMTISQLNEWLQNDPILKGEFCIIVEGLKSTNLSNLELNHAIQSVQPSRLINALSEYLGSKQIAEVMAKCELMSKKMPMS